MAIHLRDFASRRLVVAAGFSCLSLAIGMLYSVLVPPWQAPDEPRHVEYAILLSEKGWLLSREDISPALQRDIMTSMLELRSWTLLGHQEPDAVPASFSDDPLLKRSGTQFGRETPLYYLLPALAFHVLPEGDLLARLYLLRWFSVLLSATTVCVVSLTAFELFPQDRFLIVAIPSFVALLPMFAFVGASANNDALSTLMASLFTWQLVRTLNRGLSWPSGLTLCGLAVLALLAKRTSFFTLPLILVAVVVQAHRRRLSVSRGCKRAIAASSMLGLLLILVLLNWRGGDAADWMPLQRSSAGTRTETVARSGSYSLQALDSRLMQALPFNTVRALRGKTVTLQAWAISPGARQRGSIVIEDDQGRSTKVFVAGSAWTRYEVTLEVAPAARTMRLILDPNPGAGQEGEGLFFDDLSLVEEGKEARNWLENGSAETPALRLESFLRDTGLYVSSSQLLDPRSYDLASLGRYLLYVLLTFAGFWANFGWLTLPLDPGWYALLALVTLASLTGLLSWGIGLLRGLRAKAKREPSSSDTVLLVFLAGFALLVVQTFLPMIGSQWQPQGRYLFPGLTIIATLFAFGIRRLARRLRPGLLGVAYVGGFLLFDLLCVFGYLLPHYYG